MLAMSLWRWWLQVCASSSCGFVALVDMSLCRWWLWICCGYEFGNGFVPVVVVDVVVAVVVVVLLLLLLRS